MTYNIAGPTSQNQKMFQEDNSIEFNTYGNRSSEIKHNLEAKAAKIYEQLVPFTAVPLDSNQISLDQCHHFFNLVSQINELIPDLLIKQHLIRLNKRHPLGEKLGWKDYKESAKDINHLKYRRLHECFEMLSMKYKGGLHYDEPTQNRNQFENSHNEAVKIEKFLYLAMSKMENISLSQKALDFTRMIDENSYRSYNYFWSNIDSDFKNRTIPSYEEMKAYVDFMIETKQWEYFDRNYDLTLNEMNAKQYVWAKWFYLITKSGLDEYQRNVLKFLILKCAKENLLDTKRLPELFEIMKNYCQNLKNWHHPKEEYFLEDLLGKYKYPWNEELWNNFKNHLNDTLKYRATAFSFKRFSGYIVNVISKLSKISFFPFEITNF